MTTGSLSRRIAAVLGTGLVLQFWSEYVFLNEGPARALAAGPGPETLTFALFYAYLGWVFLVVLGRFPPRDLWGVFLAGCVFGWATEALFVPLVYEAPPISFFWPSVGWHALVDVMLGFIALRLLMRRGPLWAVALAHVGAGLAWAWWALWLAQGDDGGGALSPSEFTRMALWSGSAWLLGLWLADRGPAAPDRPGRVETGTAALSAALLYALTGALFWPFALALLVVIALTLLVLSRTRGTDGPLTRWPPPPGPVTYAAAALMPLSAIAAYPVFLEAGLRAPVEDLPALLFVIGTGVWILAMIQGFRRRQGPS